MRRSALVTLPALSSIFSNCTLTASQTLNLSFLFAQLCELFARELCAKRRLSVCARESQQRNRYSRRAPRSSSQFDSWPRRPATTTACICNAASRGARARDTHVNARHSTAPSVLTVSSTTRARAAAPFALHSFACNSQLAQPQRIQIFAQKFKRKQIRTKRKTSQFYYKKSS